MIPLKLSLKNFLCYGESAPVLDLSGIHVACLWGQNGHGKSALLDAITWVLWGRARSRGHDELIHYGSVDMLVDLEFQAREARYRVVRRHSRGTGRRRQGASDLQFQVHSGADYRPITGNSMRETQDRIDQVTGMDYDTFINSAFLVQGRADEFTNKRPGERKEVLARILGLGYYDRLQERAKGVADEKRAAAAGVERDLERMQLEVSRRDGYSAELEVVNRELTRATSRLETSQEKLGVLKTKAEDLRRIGEELAHIRSQVPVIEADISGLQKEVGARQERIAVYEALIREKDAIQAGTARYQQMGRRYEELNSKRERFDVQTAQKSDLERAVEGARVRLEEQVTQQQRRVDVELCPRVEATPTIHEKLQDERARLESLAGEELSITDRHQKLNELAERMGQIGATAEQLKAEGQELRSKLNLVLNSHEGARCPLCNGEVGPEGIQHLSDGYNTQIEEKLRLYRQNESALNAAELEKIDLDRDLPQHEAALRRSQDEAHKNIAVLESRLKESHLAAEELERARQELAQGRDRLEQGTYANVERERLAQLEGEVESLGYDQEAHRRLYGEMQELRPFEERQRRLEEAIAGLPREGESLAWAQQMYSRRQEDLSASTVREREIESQVTELPRVEEELAAAALVYRELESQSAELFRRQVGLEGQLKRVEALENELADVEASLRAIREEQAISQELAEAFGKRGVQAMLIETVLPRVEEEANALLGRMTDNRMHMKLETQRERRTGKGEPIETLEIKISDEMGPRSYELFSGGEAFRINLALRIALSKVLAHRRGAPLPTLFIDEGFGTQDAAGRERILDVIRAIEGDFEKIIVITHLDEIKDAFPAHIQVLKEGTSSTFWISY